MPGGARTSACTTEGDHGTDTGGAVVAGKIAGGCACVGVTTETNGTTSFVECDADGEEHGPGREMDCFADGDTGHLLLEHGSGQEQGLLHADGTCRYDGAECRADYAPFVALLARVLPIKARPALVPTQPPLCRIYFGARAAVLSHQ